ncbi:MAG: penicillin acylase family protein [Deltaproteobacteria bacterium]|nr:MAG: penicillin acylase family protein [Deltaproteobacteria bacterium]
MRRGPLVPFVVAVTLAFAPTARATDVTDLPVAQTFTFLQLSAPVDVVRDTHGIPHVYASTLNDASFVIGYVHATDRLFQMDVFRRIPSGTVSEILGFPDFQVGASNPTDPPFPGNIGNVTQDLFFQTLGLRRAAVDSFNAMSPAVQSALQSYADGVNEVIARVNASGTLPAEYGPLNITHIDPWTPIDSIAFGKLQAFELSFDFDDDLANNVASVEAGFGTPTGDTAFFDDLARIEPAENAFTVPDASNSPIPLAGLAASKAVMLASSASHERPSTSAPPRTDATIAPSARGGAGVERAAADVSAAAHRSGRKSARQPSTAERRAVAAARKATFTKAREYIAQLMQQPAMRAIRERGTVGSNEWAVDGSVTDTGHPILANDPHLGLGSPATFYELHINTKDRGGNLNVTGIGFAGAPGVVQGHNEHIAWGSTTNPTDVTDWYLEDVSSDGAGNLFSHYLGNPEPITQLPLQVKVNIENGNVTGFERTVLAVAVNQLSVHGIVDVTPLLANIVPPKVLIVTRHGPIFPQTLQPYPFPANQTGGSALSIQFTGLFPTREIETFFVWNQATNLADFKAGLQLFDFGSQNWSYIDDAGNVAYFASGEFPIREDINAGAVSGNPPYLIRNGTGGNEWIPKAVLPPDQSVPYEIVPAAQVPQIENPPAHFFVNANNDPVGNTADNDPLNEALAGTGPYLGIGYDEFRAARITELIKSELNLIPTPPGTPAGDGTISFADMQRMQADVNQLEGRRLAKYFVTAVDDAGAGGAPPELASLVNSRITDARNRLAAWTYNTPTGFDTPGDPGMPSPQDLVDSVATTIYNVAVGQLVTKTFDATLAANGVTYRQGTTEAIRGLLRLLDKVPFTGVGASGLNFFDDTSVSLTAAQERDMLLVKSLQSALDLLAGASFTDAFGGSMSVDDYLWGKLHYVIFESFLDGALNDTRVAGGGAFSIPPQPAAGFPPGMPTDGSRFTVDVGNFGMRPASDTDLSFGSGPNRRSVVEMGPSGPVHAKNVIPGGEDGVVGRPHYGDQVNLWLGNGYHDALLATADVVANAEAREAFPMLPGCTESTPGRCLPGTGSPLTNCISEFFVDAPAAQTEIASTKVTIHDGGDGDFDGASDGTCVAHVVICLNNADPRIVNGDGQVCQATDVAKFEVKTPRGDASKLEDRINARNVQALVKAFAPVASVTGNHFTIINYSTPITTGNLCKSTYVRVPLRHGVKRKKLFRIRATRSDGIHDDDKLTITCEP